MTNTKNKILLVVIDFLKVHDQLEGKYWPMVDVFVERIEKGIPEKKIAKDFYKAYREAKQLEPAVSIPNVWYARVSEIACVSRMGSKWIKEMKAKGYTNFWNMLDLAKELQKEPKKKTKKTKKSNVDNKYYRYFMEDYPEQFPVLCAAYLQEERLPDIRGPGHPPRREQRLYERLCVGMLDALLKDSTFFFSPEHNWPNLCHRILQQIKPSQEPAIMDMEIVIPEEPEEEEEEEKDYE